MACVFGLREFGRSFATRERGAEIREAALATCGNEPLVVDFAGVTNVSYSFADEFVGKLACDLPDIEVRNLDESIGPVVRRAQERRAGAALR